jgi:hypothetical protein
MRKLAVLLAILAFLFPSVGTAFGGVDWDGDPVYNVDGAIVYVEYSINGGNFVRDGGHIKVEAVAPKIRLLDSGPEYVSASAERGGHDGELAVTTRLTHARVPKTFLIRIRVPADGREWIMEVKNGATAKFKLDD